MEKSPEELNIRVAEMGPVRMRHTLHDFGWQSNHRVDLAGWQAKMASIEISIPWRNLHKPHSTWPMRCHVSLGAVFSQPLMPGMLMVKTLNNSELPGSEEMHSGLIMRKNTVGLTPEPGSALFFFHLIQLSVLPSLAEKSENLSWNDVDKKVSVDCILEFAA